ncbi:MAG: hypothetical protein ACTSPY_13990 [Candidatus Helarchaeota archaeon]
MTNEKMKKFIDSFDEIPNILSNMNDYTELKKYILEYIKMIKEEYIINKKMPKKQAFKGISFLINIIVLNQYMLNTGDFHALMNKTSTKNRVFKFYIYQIKSDIYYLKGYEEFLHKIVDLGIPYKELTENIEYWTSESTYLFHIYDFEILLKKIYEK